jgi:hypothetical protein
MQKYDQRYLDLAVIKIDELRRFSEKQSPEQLLTNDFGG